MLRVGIIGTGYMANSHVQHFQALPDVKVVACTDINQDRARAFAQRYSIAKVTPDAASLLELVDAVSVVTFDNAHAALAIQALNAGKHVLCEKPLASTLEEALQIEAAALQASQRGQVHMVNFTKRDAPALQEAIRVARSGVLGDIRFVHGHYFQSWLSTSCIGPWTDSWLLWRLTSACGSLGVLGDLGAHLLDYATAVAGEGTLLSAALATHDKQLDGKTYSRYGEYPLDVNDSAVFALRFNNGALGSFCTSRFATGRNNQERLEVHGTLGAMMFDFERSGEKLWVATGEARHNPDWTIRKCPPVANTQKVFVDAILGKGTVPTDISRGVAIQRYMDACLRLARQVEK